MTHRFADPSEVMRRAVALAAQGVGRVEPNPPVGAVLVDGQLALIAEGWHERFGGPHAEINALQAAGEKAAGATLFVTLEPCCHQGKTPPCTKALIEAGVRRVVVGMHDPAPHDSGRGTEELRKAGIEVEVGLLQDEIQRLTAPFVKLATTGLPWVHAKWAMTLDGKIASRTGDSRWISGEASRLLVHQLRGRMDAVVVGANTARRDDPLLTARPPGPRTATRIVVDGKARLDDTSQLARTTGEAPVLLAVGPEASDEDVSRLRRAGIEVLQLPAAETPGDRQPGGLEKKAEVAEVERNPSPVDGAGGSAALRPQPPGPPQPPSRVQPPGPAPDAPGSLSAARVDLVALLRELGRREMTNVLVEGGGRLLGSFFDRRLIDECHVFVSPKLLGGAGAVSPLSGIGLQAVSQAWRIDGPLIEVIEQDVYIHGPLRRPG